MTDLIEAQCTRWAKLANGGVSIGLQIHLDDAFKVAAVKPNRRYEITIKEIGDDELAAPSHMVTRLSSPRLLLTRCTSASASRRGGPSTSPDKRLVQQASIMCAKPHFRTFLEKTVLSNGDKCNTEMAAREILRDELKIDSIANIIIGTPAADKWDRLMGRFSAWERGM